MKPSLKTTVSRPGSCGSASRSSRWRSRSEPKVESWRDYQREFCPPDGMLKVLGYLKTEYGGAEGYARSAGLTDRQIESLRNALVE